MKRSSLSTALGNILLLSLVSLIAVPTPHSAEEKARDKWMSGYVALEKAEDAEEQGKPAAAHELFRKALETFNLVRREYPTWNPSLLDYRINYCADRIKQLGQEIARGNEELTKPELVSLTQSHTRTIGELEKENIELRQELSSTREALARARREAARKMTSQQNMADLMAENRALQEKSEGMAGIIESKNKELAELREEAGLKAVTERLQEELAQIKATKANLENAYKTYQKAYGNVKIRLKTATIEREQALEKNHSITEELTVRSKQIEEQNQQIKTLDTEIKRLKREISTREAELKQARSQITEETEQNELLQEKLQQTSLLQGQLEEQKNRNALEKTTVLEKKLSDSEITKQQQQKRIENQEQKIAALEETEKLLETKVEKLADSKNSLRKLQEELLDQDLRYKKHQAIESDMTREINRLRGMLETARAENRSILSDLEEFRERRQNENEERIELRKLLDASESRTNELLTERDRLQSQGRLRLEMLQEQEDQIASLEEKLNTAENKLNDKIKDLEELEREKALSADKLAVVDGLTANMSDIDKELNATREKLADALDEKDRLNVQIDDLSRSLKNKNNRIEAYRKAIAEERTSHGKSEDTLTAQLKKLNSQLETERRARQDLESVLSQREAAPEKMPPPSRVSAAGEQELRRRDAELIIRGFLSQAASAEEEGNVETAIWNYRKVLERDPEREPALRRLGIIASENGNDKDAVRYLKRAFRENPDNLDTLRTLGFALIRRSQADLAISALSRAAAIEPKNPEVHRHLGVACSMLGWKDAAEVQFMRTYELDKKDSGNAFNLAILLASLDPPRMEEAKSWYLKAKDLGNPGDPGLDEFFKEEKQ